MKADNNARRALSTMLGAMDALAEAKRALKDMKGARLGALKESQESVRESISEARNADPENAQPKLHMLLAALDARCEMKVEYSENLKAAKEEVDRLQKQLDETIKETRQLSLFETAA